MVSVASVWDTLKEAIAAYTGLSPAAFFTVLIAAVTLYHIVSGFFAAPAPPPRRDRGVEPEPLPESVQVGEITEEELRAYDGTDPKKPLLMAIKGQIYDVTRGRMFYGPEGPYALFAGRDASRALAKMSFEETDITGDISGLGPFELDALQDWEYNFMAKYIKVGTVKKPDGVTGESTSNGSEKEELIAQPTEASADHSDEQTAKPSEVDASADHVAETKGFDSANASADHVAETKGSKGSDSANASADHVAETKGSDSANA